MADTFIPEEINYLLDKAEAADNLYHVYVLAQGTDWEEKPYWCYMALPPSRVMEFQEARERGENNLIDYGNILGFGYGAMPDEETQKFMEDSYGITHDFEKELEEQLRDIAKKEELKAKYTTRKEKTETEDSSKDTE
jgi:hypothetical protein